MMVKTKLFLPVLLLTSAFVLLIGTSIVRASTFGSVSGKVTDSAGKAVAGVKINLPGGGSVTTDKSGSYDLEGVDPGEYKLEATKKGYDKTSLDITITQDVSQEVDVTITKTPVPATVPASKS